MISDNNEDIYFLLKAVTLAQKCFTVTFKSSNVSLKLIVPKFCSFYQSISFADLATQAERQIYEDIHRA